MSNLRHVRMTRRVAVTLSHLLISLLAASLAALVVFGVWYPYPYRIISGGQSIFFILISVDVILGPLMTLVIAKASKPRKELIKDLIIIGVLQFSALAYGLTTVFEARPVHTVFERDRFQVVHAIEVPRIDLDTVSSDINAMPISGPTLLSLRPFRNNGEETELTFQSTVGITLAAQPSLWIPLETDIPSVVAKAKTVGSLRALFPANKGKIDAAVQSSGLPEDQLAYLPLVSRQAFWTVLIDKKTARPAAYIDLDPYEVTPAK